MTQLTITDKLRSLNHDIEEWPGQHLQFLRCLPFFVQLICLLFVCVMIIDCCDCSFPSHVVIFFNLQRSPQSSTNSWLERGDENPRQGKADGGTCPGITWPWCGRSAWSFWQSKTMWWPVQIVVQCMIVVKMTIKMVISVVGMMRYDKTNRH